MVSVSVPGMYGWGNSSSQLLGVLGSSPSHRSGLGAPFFCGETASLRPPPSTRTRHPRRLGVPMTRGSAGPVTTDLKLMRQATVCLPA
jgi:hypothetical protein